VEVLVDVGSEEGFVVRRRLRGFGVEEYWSGVLGAKSNGGDMFIGRRILGCEREIPGTLQMLMSWKWCEGLAGIGSRFAEVSQEHHRLTPREAYI
jgi:hypothetical protein